MTQTMTDAVACGGIGLFMGLAWLLSESRRDVKLMPVLGALATQVGLATLMLRVEPVRDLFLWLSGGIGAIKQATLAGTSFVYGYVGGAPLPFELKPGGNPFIFGLQALPMVLVISSLSMVLFHWKILPLVVRGVSWLLSRTLRVGGALGVCAAAKVFLGQTEAPLLIRPYLSKLTRSELFCVMTLGMATTSAAVMVIYASILENTLDHPIRHILTASFISVPAAVAISRLMIPHTGPHTDGELESPYKFSGAMEAVSHGATEGMKLYLNIIPMLIVSLALVSLCNSILGNVMVAEAPLSLQRILGVALSPLAFVMGIPWEEAMRAGQLIGTKLAMNEVMAFIELAKMPSEALSPHSRLIMTYALCGFANLSSIGIQIGGIGTMVPERRAEIIGLGFRSMLAGMLSTCLSGTIVGLLS
jgi:CNT family concentrative nucleoside transporter